MSQNDASWELIFKNGNLLEQIERDGFVTISPAELKRLGNNREPRLLAKQDQIKSVPKIFFDNDISILGIRNDEYVLFKDKDRKTYYSLEKTYDTIDTDEYFPERDFSEYQSLNLQDISSESQAIDYACLVSLIKTFTGEDELHLTIRGRQRSQDFSFTLPTGKQISVSGVQIEVDAGYESPGKIYIIEGKIGRVDTFNIRQLYYPYRDWLLKSTKTIVPIFFVYTNGLFYFIEFKFHNTYGDLEQVKSKCYTVNESKKQTINLGSMLKTVTIEREPDAPYPQANDLDKIVDIVVNCNTGLKNKKAIAEFFDFEDRQGDYYANAAIYLGLLKRKIEDNSEFELTRTGRKIAISENRKNRNYIIVQQLLKRPSFNEIINNAYSNKKSIDEITVDFVADVILKYVNISSNTARRRASTVIRWLKWINDNVEFQ